MGKSKVEIQKVCIKSWLGSLVSLGLSVKWSDQPELHRPWLHDRSNYPTVGPSSVRQNWHRFRLVLVWPRSQVVCAYLYCRMLLNYACMCSALLYLQRICIFIWIFDSNTLRMSIMYTCVPSHKWALQMECSQEADLTSEQVFQQYFPFSCIIWAYNRFMVSC